LERGLTRFGGRVRILVTGCAGFIGSHLCERLLDAGHAVTGVDALTENYDPVLKRRNLETCLGSRSFRFLHSLIGDLSAEVLQEAEVVFHLAARPGVRTSWGSEFGSYVTHNVLETQRLLEGLRNSACLRRLVYASSSSVYGNAAEAQVTEDSPTAPFSPYGVTKLAAEHLCSAYAENYGVPTVALRLFTVCGPRQRPDMLLSRVISAAFRGEKLTLYGSAPMERDFTCVLDAVEALVLAAERPTQHRIFNISGGQPAPVAAAIRMVEEILGTRVNVERGAGQRGDVRRTAADLTRARAELGYSPRWRLEDTVRAQVEYSLRHPIAADRTVEAG
jgi:UDP-glucuronate 4-epimerase